MARGLSSLLKAVESACSETPIERQFVLDLYHSIQKQSEKEVRVPSKTFKPSSIGGCKRNIVYQLLGVQPDEESSSVNLIGINESGTDRHERLQTAITQMKENGIDCEYVDVESFIKMRDIQDIEIVEKRGIETKCYNKKYNISFLTDGIIKYRGKYYILEIKTEKSSKFWEHKEVRPEHIAQGIAYRLSFGITQVLYLYENRDTLDKKAFLLDVNDEMTSSVIDVISECSHCAKNNIIPQKSEDTRKCTYCKYKTRCNTE